jgi:hypothetical protein
MLWVVTRPGGYISDRSAFIPCYQFTSIPAPCCKRYGKLPGVVAFAGRITAAAIGVITGIRRSHVQDKEPDRQR